MNSENQWKAALRKAIESIGGQALSLHGHGMQAPGWPDLWVGHRLWKGWIELKAMKGELSTAQRIVGKRLEKIGSFFVLRASTDYKSCRLEDALETPYPREPIGILDAAELMRRLA